jgi:hypothetical protein
MLGQTEEYDEGFPEGIRLPDGILEGMVAFGPLRRLHPIDDESAGAHSLGVERSDSFHLNDFMHGGRAHVSNARLRRRPLMKTNSALSWK